MTKLHILLVNKLKDSYLNPFGKIYSIKKAVKNTTRVLFQANFSKSKTIKKLFLNLNNKNNIKIQAYISQ
jgi:hypothetical protein